MIAINSEIKVGTFMKVALADMNIDWYKTIVRFVDLNHIMIDIPANDHNKQLLLSEGVELEFRFSHFFGMYTFRSKFEELFKHLDLAIVEKPVEIYKIRARNYARVPVCIKAKIDQRNGCITNLSADGLFFKTNYRYSVGDIVQIDFQLEKTDISLKGKVIWLSDNNGHGIKFTEIKQEMVKSIDYYVMKNIIMWLF